MFRKTAFALATIAAISAAALIPTEASAKGFKFGGGGFHHHGFGWGAFGAAALITSAAIASSNCYRWVQTRDGDTVRVNVCDE